MNWQNYEAPKEESSKSTTPAQTQAQIPVKTTPFSTQTPPKKEPPKNDFMYEYLMRFKDGGMVLKPKELIFIPKPPPPVLKPNPILDYKQVSYTGFGGFQTTTL
jgi:hypothetical protein